jgi:hypothetical protein
MIDLTLPVEGGFFGNQNDAAATLTLGAAQGASQVINGGVKPGL